ncbi:hypothetical protein CsSME_00036300 [Camellia sinensis var. sinensis]
MVAFPYFDLIINYKGKVGRVYDVDPNMYCYIDALQDVIAIVLAHIGCSEAIAITLHCDMLGTEYMRLIENDLDVLDMFYVQGRSKTINLYVDIVYSIGMEDGGDKNDVGDGNGGGGDGVHTIDVDEEYHEDNVCGFNDKDRDWNAIVDDEHESDGTESLSEKDNEESNEDDDDDNVLSDYQSSDDEVRYSSCDDEFDGKVDWMDDEEIAYLGNQFDSTYSGKEPYFNQEGEVVLEKRNDFSRCA